MTRLLAWSLALAVLLVVALNAQQQPPATTAVVPRLIRFAGSLHDGSGKPISGVVGISFALYKNQAGGAPLWMETQNVPLDASGRYSVLLGATNEEGVPMELFTSGEAQWLGVQVDGQLEQARILLVSVPYALKAADADTVGGLPPSAFALAAPAASTAPSTSSDAATASVVPAASSAVTTPGGVINKLAKFDASADIVSSQVFDNGTNVGVGNTAPAAKLDVSGGGIFRGVLQLPATGTATSVNPAGFPSQPLEFASSDWNSSMLAAVQQRFRWQALQLNSNTASPSATLNLLFASGTGTPAQTGLKISSKGIIIFASGQTLPTVTGNETVTGNISAKQLISTVATGTPPLSVSSTTQVANLNASLLGGLASNAFAQIAAANIFSVNQTVRGDPGSGGSAGTIKEIIGNVGCGGGDTGQGSAGIDFTGVEDCKHYSLVGDGANTFINRATGGKLHFREGNSDEIVILGGGDVGVGTGNPSGRLAIVGATGTGTNGEAALIATGGNGSNGGDGVTGFGGGGGSGINQGDGDGGVFTGGSLGGDFGDGVSAVAGSGDAARFIGDIQVTGAVVAGIKDFEIDHPLDPGNKYLLHASVESSEMLDIYTGNITTDVRGEAIVQLPDWFEALNTDFRYQLTVIGQFAQAIVSREIQDHQFQIRTNLPNVKVSWQVTGVRQDAFAQAHPLVVEQEKVAGLRGFYIHPELYGAPEERQIEWARHPETMRRMQEVRKRQQQLARDRAAPK